MYLNIRIIFLLRSFSTNDKAENGYNNVYFNDAYCNGFGEQVFSSGNVPEANLGDNNELNASANNSAAVLKGQMSQNVDIFSI